MACKAHRCVRDIASSRRNPLCHQLVHWSATCLVMEFAPSPRVALRSSRLELALQDDFYLSIGGSGA